MGVVSAFAFICITLAMGAAAFLYFAGRAILAVAQRPRAPRHEHSWETTNMVETFDEFVSTELPVYRTYVLRCSTCGDVTTRKVK